MSNVVNRADSFFAQIFSQGPNILTQQNIHAKKRFKNNRRIPRKEKGSVSAIIIIIITSKRIRKTIFI